MRGAAFQESILDTENIHILLQKEELFKIAQGFKTSLSTKPHVIITWWLKMDLKLKEMDTGEKVAGLVRTEGSTSKIWKPLTNGSITTNIMNDKFITLII